MIAASRHDLGNSYLANATVHENGLSVSFDIYKDALPEPRLVADGFVKWDGCSNWSTTANHMIHFCDLDDIDRFALALKKCYDVASELMAGEADF